MPDFLECCADQRRKEAVAELAAELTEFSQKGLVRLRGDLVQGRVLRGGWAGCVISYKGGHPGSTRRDRLGRANNPFTILWDRGWITDDEVLDSVDLELRRRGLAEDGSEIS